ncbi:N-acetylglucosamine-6-phosphate deacetylase [Thermus tengchongensis]|uniref:N-acetylglucosamine-6-phosphate deacetylase n=1 Tax=Thermus tengchongensis TaxID=1214928 RepID=A0A4Y9FA37_9DEIN|nr:N-acetylglucosamine-6-phosphate deacetylase [Thermus tengchongensis]TFU25951.1 N-acetylglucosamine-6-phosphate deacetylase [Thermus tengchongensis]
MLEGTILTPSGFVRGRLHFSERIEAIEEAPVEGPYILPGFLDLHVHGGGGLEVMEGREGVETTLRFHLQHGTTGLLATTVTAPLPQLERALLGIQEAMAGPLGEALLGVHLEGPFISKDRLGAQPPFPLLPDLETAQWLLSLAPVKVLTLAPELPGALDFLRFLAERGVRVQLGHTAASYAEAEAALEAGASGFTHLYNAMTGLHHREPGVVGLALERGTWAEIIPDGLHVHPAALKLALKSIPGLYFVTDAVAAAGMPDGEYPLGAHRVEKRGNGVWHRGSLAGSTLTMDQALRNLVAWGMPLEEAARRLSTLPARYLGLGDRGEIAPGKRADLVVLDGELRVQAVFLGGKRV